MATEVIQSVTKANRDAMFTAFRETGNAQEKQAIKYSEPVQQPDGTWATGWFVAYPSGQDQY